MHPQSIMENDKMLSVTKEFCSEQWKTGPNLEVWRVSHNHAGAFDYSVFSYAVKLHVL